MTSLLKSIDKKAIAYAIFATILVLVLVVVGSRNLQNFDAALITYLFGTVFAIFGTVYRYSVWIQRPPTKIYFRRSFQIVFSKDFFKFISASAKDMVQNVALQKFIFKRNRARGFAHFLMATGCMLAFAITIPLTFGWIHFTLDPTTGLNPDIPNVYIAHFFGFEMGSFLVHSLLGVIAFGALNWCSLLVIIGATYFLRKRLVDPGLIATQTFEGDILPLLLLLLISITGICITLDYHFMKGFAYSFIAVFHALFVIIFLIWIPFGKFFHIIQRPAQIGAHIYKTVGTAKGMKVCSETNQEYATKMHVDDLKEILPELGFELELENGKHLLDYSPEGKRDLLAKAHLKARQEDGRLFG